MKNAMCFQKQPLLFLKVSQIPQESNCVGEFLFFLKACVRYFSLFLKEQCVFWLFRTKYFETKFNLQLFYLPTVPRTNKAQREVSQQIKIKLRQFLERM